MAPFGNQIRQWIGQLLLGNPTGGLQGPGTINVATGYFVGGVPLTVGSNVNNFAASNPTIALINAGQTYRSTVTTLTATIPANASIAFPIGTMLTFINSGGGVMSIAITTDTMTLANSATTGTRSLASNGIATAIKMTATAWLISGNGLT